MTASRDPQIIENPGEIETLLEATRRGASDRVETARTLPPGAFTSPEFHRLEIERLFRRDWLCLGHVAQIPEIGDYMTIDLFGAPLMVVRAPEGIRVLSRVCRHRWGEVAQGSGNARSFICPIHGWAYGLDGSFLGARFMDRAAGFEAEALRLPALRCEVVEPLGLIFASFGDPADSIGERLAGLAGRLAHYRLGGLAALAIADTEEPFNWKIGISTGMEAYHHFVTHRQTFERRYPSALSRCEETPQPGWTLCHAKASGDARRTRRLPVFPDLDEAERQHLDLYHIFPATRLIVFPDTIRVRIVMPEGPLHTRVRSFSLVAREVAAEPGLVAEAFAEEKDFTERFTREDFEVSLMQQHGAASPLAEAGRLSHLEASLWHFYDYVRERVAAA